MKRVRLLCGLAGLVLAVGFAGGQAPPADKPAEKVQEVKVESSKSLEEAIAAAMKNNPDVRVAEAEAQVAQAKLAQTKLAVAQKVTAAQAGLEHAREAANAVRKQLELIEKLPNAPVSDAEKLNLRATLAKYQSEVAKHEAEYNALLGVMPGQKAETVRRLQLAEEVALASPTRFERSVILDANALIELVQRVKPTPGSVADKLREALDRPVKLDDQKNVDLGAVLTKLTKAAGLDVRVRVPPAADPALVIQPASVTLPEGEMPLGAWIQLVVDEYANWNRAEPIGSLDPAARYEIYVREYGLLVADPKNAPPGAMTVQEFWQQLRAEKAKAGPKK